jgi:hypothetical protein
LRRNCLVRQVGEGKIEGSIPKQLLDETIKKRRILEIGFR